MRSNPHNQQRTKAGATTPRLSAFSGQPGHPNGLLTVTISKDSPCQGSPDLRKITRMTTTAAKRRKETVERGAAWLDKVDPTWIDRVDLSKLDLADGCYCVLGQIVSSKTGEDSSDPAYDYGTVVTAPSMGSLSRSYGIFRETVRYLRNVAPRGVKGLVMSHDTACDRGFHVPKDMDDREDEWVGLTNAWKRLIRARRKQAAATA